jgi:hypothetical protein
VGPSGEAAHGRVVRSGRNLWSLARYAASRCSRHDTPAALPLVARSTPRRSVVRHGAAIIATTCAICGPWAAASTWTTPPLVYRQCRASAIRTWSSRPSPICATCALVPVPDRAPCRVWSLVVECCITPAMFNAARASARWLCAELLDPFEFTSACLLQHTRCPPAPPPLKIPSGHGAREPACCGVVRLSRTEAGPGCTRTHRLAPIATGVAAGKRRLRAPRHSMRRARVALGTRRDRCSSMERTPSHPALP